MFGLKATTTAGMMGAVAGLLFLIVMLAAPRHGIITRLLHQRRLSGRIVREDILGVLYRLEEREGQALPAEPANLPLTMVAGGGSVAGAVARLRREGKLTREPAGIALTDAGRAEARGIIRAHRLWETYLEQNLPLPLDHLHAPAERLEHVTDVAMKEKLAEATEHPQRDPQGKQVPPDM
jgi:Mn-dependent DtxR family transcriptional regulator